MVQHVKNYQNCLEEGEIQEFKDEVTYLVGGLQKSHPVSVRWVLFLTWSRLWFFLLNRIQNIILQMVWIQHCYSGMQLHKHLTHVYCWKSYIIELNFFLQQLNLDFRCLSATNLASKCQQQNFRLYLRAHNVLPGIFSVLQDANAFKVGHYPQYSWLSISRKYDVL